MIWPPVWPFAWPFIFAGLIGLCLGSFATTAALRSLRWEQAVFGGSSCDHCGVSLSYLQSIPVLSFARQGGACVRCGGRIEPLHLVGEISGAIIAVLCCLIASPARAIAMGFLGLVLLASAVIDAKSRRLPDVLTAMAAILCAGLAATASMSKFVEGLMAAAIAFVVLEGLRRGFLRFRGQAGLGFGDVKLIAALALWLGAQTPWAVALAAVVGLMGMAIVKPDNGRLAFGPALAAAGLMVGFAGEGRLWTGLV